jgi:methylase of polypeptide subunit release factors
MNPDSQPLPPVGADPESDALLVLAAGGDATQLRILRARVASGEPPAYVAGFTVFRGRRFRVDPRAYITDPELTSLIDVLAAEGRQLEHHLGRPLCVLEFGVGAGTLAITVKREHPAWSVWGLDVDREALAVAAENVREHGVEVGLLESDYFAEWLKGMPAPDVIFGDPPWGSAGDLYAEGRNAQYYRRMPARSAFPPGGSRCAVHDRIIAEVRALGWPSLLVLNYGVLPRAVIAPSVAPLREFRLLSPQPHLTVMVGRAS